MMYKFLTMNDNSEIVHSEMHQDETVTELILVRTFIHQCSIMNMSFEFTNGEHHVFRNPA